MNKKIENFSTGYWRIECTIVAADVDKPQFDIEDIYPFLIEAESEEPLLVRINGLYLLISSSSSIPYKHLVVPEDYEGFFDFDLPQEAFVLIPKMQEEMKQILQTEDDDNFAWQISDEEDFRGGNIP